MARAVNQSVAWVTAVFLSLFVFGGGLAIVFNLQPQNGPSKQAEHESESAHQSHNAKSPKDSAHTANSEIEHAKPKIEREDPHAKEEGDEDVEITPASLKAHDEEHTPEAKPHH